MSIIWPWAAREAVEAHKADADRLQAMNDRLEEELKEANYRFIVANSNVHKLRGWLAEAHFRDPKTGRLEKKGYRP
jgi:cysteine sulfinate desulfinase/cysteine desulfurase-like protein